uniref:Uncharacterized protein n=1 Tax=Arundo donax TaxID=35708 RepID=A0A0A8YZT3_ARUDO
MTFKCTLKRSDKGTFTWVYDGLLVLKEFLACFCLMSSWPACALQVEIGCSRKRALHADLNVLLCGFTRDVTVPLAISFVDLVVTCNQRTHAQQLQ